MKKEFIIRKIRKAEIPFCATVVASSEPWLTLGRKADQVSKLLRDTEREVYVAKDRKNLLGLIVICMKGAFVGYIQAICVMPEHQGKGTGTKLIQFAERRIFKESPNTFLLVSSFNTKARMLYQRLGYQRVGELPDYVVPGHSEILMRKSIGSLEGFKKT